MANEVEYNIVSTGDYCIDYGGFNDIGSSGVGTLSMGETVKGAVRFTSVAIPQGYTVNMARLYIASNEKVGSGRVRFNIYGIKETNTANFSSPPFGRAKTSAQVAVDSGINDFGNFIDRDVTSIIREIVGQGGWSSGNALGLTFENDGSDTDTRFIDGSAASYLMIRLNAEPNFKPTPVTVSAPTFPAAGDWGLRISKPGIDVKTATESQLLFTSRKKALKVLTEGEATCVAGVLKQIAHNLGYVTPVLVYIQGSDGKRFKLNRILFGSTDPVTNGKQGVCGSSNNHLEIYADGTAYYYVLIDPLTA